MIAVAWTALFLWPVAAIVFYQKLTLPVALCVTIVGGYLLLPSVIALDLPLLPPLDKRTIPSLSALVLTAIAIGGTDRRHLVMPGWLPRNFVPLLLMAMLLVGVAGAVATNRDVVVYGDRVLRGLSPYDGFSILMDQLFLLIPLLLARRVLASSEGQRVLLLTLVISALIYTIPALYEVRMSPQLHTRVYGFFPSSFAQAMRDGGFRPLVFLNHGLSLAIFMTFALLAAAGLWGGTESSDRWKWAMAIAWLFFVLVLTKTLGALVIALLLLPMILFLKPRTQLLAATCIAGIVMVYPVLRAAHLIPVDQIMSVAEDISPARAASLNTRIENEDMLLAKAQERPLFGWGGWGRNRVFDEQGRNLSITDGSWVIELGLGGWVRYLAVFGLMCWPIIGLFIAQRKKVDPVCTALALILAAKLIDLVPNSGFPAVIWLTAGSLLGRLEMKLGDRVEKYVAAAPGLKVGYARDATVSDKDSPATGPRYARAFPQKGDRSKPPYERQADKKPRRKTSYSRLRLRPGYRR